MKHVAALQRFHTILQRTLDTKHLQRLVLNIKHI